VPFEWTSGFGLSYPRGYPALIVTSEIGHSFLDHYIVSPSPEVKKACINIGEAIVNEIGFTQINEQNVCFHYTGIDHYFVNNTNAYAAAYLARLSDIVFNKRYYELALAACKFVEANLLDNGCWFYYAPPFVERNRAIDNRHTGYTIVGLLWANAILKDRDIEKAIDKGWEFYRHNFLEECIPKSRMDSLYPVDMHDVAQLIVTASELGEIKLARDCARWAIDNMSNTTDEFYYRLYPNGTVIKIPFVRWNQAWMYRALTSILQ
jgi:hypothetical protein